MFDKGSIHLGRYFSLTPFRVRGYGSQARRQKFPEGGSSIRQGVWGPLTAPKMPWGISCKILQSNNFQALHANFRKVLISFKGGGVSYEPLEPHLDTGVGPS